MGVVILLRSIATRGPSPSTIEFTSIAAASAVDERFDAARGTPMLQLSLASIASDDRDSKNERLQRLSSVNLRGVVSAVWHGRLAIQHTWSSFGTPTTRGAAAARPPRSNQVSFDRYGTA
jgi:hypothetical protein